MIMPETIVTPPVLDIRDLWVSYNSDSRSNAAVSGLNVRIRNREAVALVGESGCGKSTTAMSILRLLPKGAAVEGAIEYLGQDLAKAPEKLLRQVRGNGIGIIFQEPMSSLNPVYTVGAQIVETLRLHLPLSRGAAKARAIELLDLVKLPDPAARFSSFPHELSGGQRQRVNIARALALRPRLVILDEAVSALDKSVEAQVLNLLLDLKRDFGLTYLFISHDLNVVRFMCDRVMVMYLGKVAELGSRDAIFEHTRHPYSSALLASMPKMDPAERTQEPPLSGDPPNPIDPPSGCRFHTRCSFAESVCSDMPPPLTDISKDQSTACLMSLPGSAHSRAPALMEA